MAYFKRDTSERKTSFRGDRSSRPDRRESSGGRFGESRRESGRFERSGDQSDFRPARKEETQAICARCGKSCILPFRPTANKPVYCSDCFRKNDSFQESRPNRSSSESSAGLEEINAKLDKIMRSLKIN